jgi:DNA-binding CsgD family transcriptional regulator
MQPKSATTERLREPLTARELQVLALVCDGYSNCEISQHIGVTPTTVKFHLLNIFGKLGVCRRTQAVAVAVHLRLAQPTWLHSGGVLPFGGHARTRRQASRDDRNATPLEACAG